MTVHQYGISAIYSDQQRRTITHWRWVAWDVDGTIRKGETATREEAVRAVHAS